MNVSEPGLERLLREEVADLRARLGLYESSEPFFRQMTDSLPALVWTTRPGGYCDFLSRQWVEYTGVPEELHHGEGWFDALHPEDQPWVSTVWRAAMEERASYDVEYRLRRHDGQYRWFKARGQAIHDDQGQIIRWFGTCTDIEDQKRAEQEIREARQAAEDANRAKDRFLAVLSHELRTPLTPVLTLAQMLEAAPELPPKLRAWVETIRRNAELETRLIDDLLDHTRISHGKIELQPAPVDVHEKIRQTCALCEAEAWDKRLDLVTDLGAARPWVHADSARLQQVLWNLIKNAVKFTPEGGTITILTADAEDGGIVVEVRDTGIGIEPHVLPRVFEVFEQGGREVTRSFGGLGLGLAISKGLIELHGGKVSAASEGPGRGAVFTVRLPASEPGPPARLAASDRAQPDPEERTRSACKVLIVEDHPDTLSAMAELVEMFGYEVRTAGTVESALRVAQGEKIDVLVSDIGRPDGSGLDLLRQLFDHHPEVLGIALTGFGMEEDLRQSQEAGFVEHLTKPINLGQLEQTLARVAALAPC
ncbi:MAG TPA: ATP-binding protein [Thermoanaerobaculia bacterium]|nr:ATP-binding protein [Thermoanaerobaculia bacterium]